MRAGEIPGRGGKMTSNTIKIPLSVAPLLDETKNTRVGIESATNYDSYASTHKIEKRNKVSKGKHKGKDVMFKRFSSSERYNWEKTIQKELKNRGGHKNLLLAEEFIDDQLMVISPLARGGDLRMWIKDGVILTPYQAIFILVPTFDALQYVHDCGIIHRDVKPSNIVLDVVNPDLETITEKTLEKGEVVPKLFDFELSRHPRIADYTIGKMVGTASYSAPEVFEGENFDPRSDIYALGVSMYELLTGKLPYQSPPNTNLREHIFNMLIQHTFEPAPDITKRNPKISLGFRSIVEKAMHKSVNLRYQTVKELKRDCLQLIDREGK